MGRKVLKEKGFAMKAKEFSSPEEWAESQADRLAPKIRGKASRQLLPKAGFIGSDLLLKTARAVWGRLTSTSIKEVNSMVEEQILAWAKEPLPKGEEKFKVRRAPRWGKFVKRLPE